MALCSKIALGVEYVGTHYHGFQSLSHSSRTIEHHLNRAVSQINQVPTKVVAAGRTDSGVHACEQVVHFKTNANRNMLNWAQGINRYLPSDIRVKWVSYVDDLFHARYSAISRRYHYLIYNASLPSVFWEKRALLYHQKIDLLELNKALFYLLGRHDFTSLRSVRCQSRSAVRIVYYASAYSVCDGVIAIDVCANGFLYHMMRNIVGTLLWMLEKKKSPDFMAWVIDQKNRCVAGKTVDSCGLYLNSVRYPRGLFLNGMSRKILTVIN